MCSRARVCLFERGRKRKRSKQGDAKNVKKKKKEGVSKRVRKKRDRVKDDSLTHER